MQQEAQKQKLKEPVLYSQHFLSFVNEVIHNTDMFYMAYKAFQGNTEKLNDSTTLRWLEENAVCRLVDRFLLYFNRILEDILTRHPEHLLAIKPNVRTLTNQELLKLWKDGKTTEDIVQAAVEKTIHDISFGNTQDLLKAIRDFLKLDLIDEERKQLVVYYTCLRNSIVHQGARVDHRFLENLSKHCSLIPHTYKAGDLLEFDTLEIGFTAAIFINIAAIYDNQVCEIWGVERLHSQKDFDSNSYRTFLAHHAGLQKTEAKRDPALDQEKYDLPSMEEMIPDHFDPIPATEDQGPSDQTASENQMGNARETSTSNERVQKPPVPVRPRRWRK